MMTLITILTFELARYALSAAVVLCRSFIRFGAGWLRNRGA